MKLLKIYILIREFLKNPFLRKKKQRPGLLFPTYKLCRRIYKYLMFKN